MKRAIVSISLLLALALWSEQAHAEWFYFGAQAGAQYFDIDAISGGEVYDQALRSATDNFNAEDPAIQIDQPHPRHYSAEGAFVWGLYAGLNAADIFRVGARLTHSFMEMEPEGVSSDPRLTFDLDLLTILLEVQLRIPISFVVPFVGLGIGYAFLGTDGELLSGGRSEYFEDRTDALDLQAALGIDFNIGEHFSLGAAAHFSFIGFYYESPDDPAQNEAVWGFVNDYLIRATVRL